MTALARNYSFYFNSEIAETKSEVQKEVQKQDPFLTAILENDDRQISKMYRQFMPMVINLVRKNRGSQDDAQDVFQDAVMIIHQKVRSGELAEMDNFKAYFLKVCKYIWMNKVRRKHRQDASLESADLPPIPADNPGIEESLHEQQMRKLFREKFSQLETWQQQILQLCFEGKKLKEVARIMGLASEGYAKKKKFLAKARLVELIQADPKFKELAAQKG